MTPEWLSRLLRAVWLSAAVWALGSPPALAGLELVKKKSCDLPPALAGVTGHVLVKYHVNDLGHVVFVEPLFSDVQPAERKQSLEQHIKECLGQWAYRASDASGWARSYLELLVAFHYFAPAPSGGPLTRLPDGRSVPRAHMEEMRSTKLKLAQELMKGPDYHEAQEGAWSLRTNVKRPERAGMMEAIRLSGQAFDHLFPGVPAAAGTAPVEVLLFGSQDQFNMISAFDNLYARFRLGGQYIPDERIAYTFGAKREAPLRISHDYLRHEVAHHHIWQRLCGETRDAPGWVDEGIASFIEMMRPPRKGVFDLMRFQRGNQVEGDYRWTAKSETYLDAFERHDGNGTLPDFEAFLRGDALTMDVDLYYGLSWILVHYLANGEGGNQHPLFVAWMLGPMGSTGDAGVAAALGSTPARLLTALRSHARVMRQRG